MMNEYCINGLTIKENLLRLAGEGNKKFTESLHPGCFCIFTKWPFFRPKRD